MLVTSRLMPEDMLSIRRHPDQLVQLGLDGETTREQAEDLAGAGLRGAWGEGWACHWHGRLVACLGLRSNFGSDCHAVAWAVLADGIAGAHLAVTRFARHRVETSPFLRIEAVALAHDAEALLAHWGALDAQQLIEAVMVDPTPACRFARAAGLAPAHVLRRYGAGAATHMLFERIR